MFLVLHYLAPLFQPIRSKAKTNRDLLACVFPRLAPVLSSDRFIGLSASVLIGQRNYFGWALRHSSESLSCASNRSIDVSFSQRMAWMKMIISSPVSLIKSIQQSVPRRRIRNSQRYLSLRLNRWSFNRRGNKYQSIMKSILREVNRDFRQLASGFKVSR